MLVYDFMPLGTPFESAAAWIRGMPADSLAAAGAVAFDCPERDGHIEVGAVRTRREVARG
jgi:hypothetical protein